MGSEARLKIIIDADGKGARVELGALAGDLNKTGGAATGAKFSFTELSSALGLAKQAYGAIKGAIDATISPVVELAGQVREMSRTIGSSAEESSKLIQAADDVGISAGSLKDALEAAIRKGVKPTIAGIADLADEYNAIQDPIERTRFLMENFGRSGADLAPLMEQGAAGIKAMGDEAEALGLVMDEAAVKSARNYEIAIDNLADAALGFKIALADEAIPALTGMANGISTNLKISKLWNEALAAGVVTQMEAQETQIYMIGGWVKQGDVLADLTERLWEHNRGMAADTARYQGLADAIAESATKTTTLTGAYDSQIGVAIAAGKASDEYATSLERVAALQERLVAAALSGVITDAAEDYQSVIAETTPEIARINAEIARYKSLQGTTWTVTTAATASVEEYELAQIKAATAAQKLAEFTGDNRQEYLELQIAADNAAEKVGKIGEDMGISQMFTADYTKKLAELNGELDANVQKNLLAAAAMESATAQFLYQQIAADLDAKAQLELGRELGLIDEPTYLAAKAAQELNRAYQDGLLTLPDLTTATGALADAINSLQSKDITITVSTLHREYYDQAGLSEAGHDGDTGQAGDGGYGVPPVTTTPDPDRDRRAMGGSVYADEPYWVGEHGPEPFVPATDGYVLSNSDARQALSGGGGGDTVIINDQAAAALYLERRRREQSRRLSGLMA